jgi:hypothetical protein
MEFEQSIFRNKIENAVSAIIYQQSLKDNQVFNARQGHGFAAEKANNISDLFRGKSAKIIGGDNAKNGADRLVDGQLIQTKYCKTARDTAASFFENGEYKYKGMIGEVPKGQGDEVSKIIKEKILNGDVNGITDPNSIEIIEGSVTYTQAENITKVGNIDSITYDIKTGVIECSCILGLSFACSFISQIRNGNELKDALYISSYMAVKTYGISIFRKEFITQIGRTELIKSIKTSVSWLVNQSSFRSVSSSLGVQVNPNGIVDDAVIGMLLLTPNFIDFFNGRISGTQLFKNAVSTGVGVVAAAKGAKLGTAAAISLGVATGGVGAFVAGVVGGAIAGSMASSATDIVLDGLIRSDADKMLDIIKSVFSEISEELLLSEQEAEIVISELKSILNAELIKDMYSSDNHIDFALELLYTPVSEVISKRGSIDIPSTDDIFTSIDIALDDIIDDIYDEPVYPEFTEYATTLYLSRKKEYPLGESFKHINQIEKDDRVFDFSSEDAEEFEDDQVLFSYDGSWMFGKNKNWFVTERAIIYPYKDIAVSFYDIESIYSKGGVLIIKQHDDSLIKLPSKFINSKSMSLFLSNIIFKDKIKDNNFKTSFRSTIKSMLKLVLGSIIIMMITMFVFPPASVVVFFVLLLTIIASPFMNNNSDNYIDIRNVKKEYNI